MPLGFNFTGDSLSPSNSGPATSGLGISIQGITTGGFSSGGASLPQSVTPASPVAGINPTVLLVGLMVLGGLLLLKGKL